MQKNSKQLTEEQEEYLRKIINQLEKDALPKKTVQRALKAVQKLKIEEIKNSLKIIAILQKEISPRFLESHYAEFSGKVEGRREVILSMYLTEGER